MHQLNPRRLVEHLANQVIDGTVAGRADHDLAWLSLGQSNQFGRVFGREVVVGHQHVTGRSHRGDRLKVFEGIKAGIFVERRIDHVGAVGREHKGVAVGAGLGHMGGANVAAGSRPVLHHEGLSAQVAELLRHDTRNRVIGATGGLGHHHRHRLAGVLVLRQSLSPEQRQDGERTSAAARYKSMGHEFLQVSAAQPCPCGAMGPRRISPQSLRADRSGHHSARPCSPPPDHARRTKTLDRSAGCRPHAPWHPGQSDPCAPAAPPSRA